jgi:integrase
MTCRCEDDAMPRARPGSAQPRATLRPVKADALTPLRAPRLLDQVRERVRYLHYSRRTEQAYVHWCKAFIRFSGLRHPKDLGAAEVEAFLTWLADERQLATATHKQALSALVFLYGKVLQVSLPWVAQLERPRVRRRLPVVLSRDEVMGILARMQGEHALLARLLYGTGMRISEALQLRVKDVDFAHQALIVREGKGGKDRVLMLPQSLAQPLREQLGRAKLLWAADAAPQRVGVELPTRGNASTRVLGRAGPGSGCSRKTINRPIRAAGSCAAITCTTRPSSELSSAPLQTPASPSPPHLTRCATASPPTCFKTDTTSAQCRTCWGTRMWRRP